MDNEIRGEAERFLDAWFETRRIVQTLNFNRFQQEGLSATQFIMLTMLGESGEGATASTLARRLNVNVTTTMRTADSLAARGLLLKTRDAANRRRSMLVLTEQGEAAHARMHEAFVGQVVAAFAGMPKDLRDGLVDGLDAFVAAAGAEKPAGQSR